MLGMTVAGNRCFQLANSICDKYIDVATDSQIQKVIESSGSLTAIAEALTDMALENDSNDDITVVLVASENTSRNDSEEVVIANIQTDKIK